MPFAETWDETLPGGSRNLNLGDDDIRSMKSALRERMAVDHRAYASEGGNTNIGAHDKVSLITGSDAAALADGFILYAKDISAVAELHSRHESAGTNQITRNGMLWIPAFNVASEARGDIIMRGASIWGRLAVGTNRQIPISDGTDLVYRVLATADMPTGSVVQVVNTQTGALATGTGTQAFGDAIPVNTEGTEVMTLAITPKATDNKLKIDVVIIASSSVDNNITGALFQDSTVNALAAATHRPYAAGVPLTLKFTHYMTAGTTSETTLKVRAAGSTAAHTLTFNGASGARIFGGVMASSITITEIVA